MVAKVDIPVLSVVRSFCHAGRTTASIPAATLFCQLARLRSLISGIDELNNATDDELEQDAALTDRVYDPVNS